MASPAPEKLLFGLELMLGAPLSLLAIHRRRKPYTEPEVTSQRSSQLLSLLLLLVVVVVVCVCVL